MRKYGGGFLKKIMILCFLLLLFPITTQAKVHIMLDPGHGGDQDGAISYDGKVKEKDINLKIGKALKEELEENYEGIEVSMTRDSDKKVDLEERVEMGKDCDFVISLHNNAIAEKPAYDNGCTVLVASGNDNKKVAEKSQIMGANILVELESLGLANHGLLVRYANDGSKYKNGKAMDHYKIIRYGILKNVPSIIVEHAFIDNHGDFVEYLSTDEQIQELAAADARGIARYFKLKEISSGETMLPIEGEEVKIYSMKNDDFSDTEEKTKVFYKEQATTEKEEETEETENLGPEEATEIVAPEETTTASTELKYKEPITKADMGGDEIGISDLEEIQEEKPFPWGLLIGSGITILLGIILLIVYLKKKNRYRY